MARKNGHRIKVIRLWRNKAEKPKITFATTAYVRCNRAMLDTLGMSFNHSASGDGNICISFETLAEEVAEMDHDDAHRAFLKSVVKQVSGKVGDIVFHL